MLENNSSDGMNQ